MAHRHPLLGGMRGGSEGGLRYPGGGGLKRQMRIGRGFWANLCSLKAHPGQLGTRIKHCIDVRDHALQYCLETLHRLVRRVSEPLASLPLLLVDHQGI